MLVTRILGDCPSCKSKNCYGNVSINQDHVLQGCGRCNYESRVFLPKIHKKVIYLDQFFFSHAFKGKDTRFLPAAERIKRMTHLQLLAAPYSSVHEDETHQWPDNRKDQLMEFIKATARGTEFEKDYYVEQAQVLKAWRAFLKGQSAEYIFEKREAIEGKLDEWDDYFRIDVGGYMRNVELKRTFKSQAVQELIKVFDEWKASTQTFEQDVALEIRDAGRIYINTYITKINRIAQGDFNAVIDSPVVANVVENMLYWLPKEQPLTDRLQRCMDFFTSEHFANVPNLWLEARMFSTLKDMVKRGAFANRNKALGKFSGIFEDFKHVSLYAPYCDAFIMDKLMADLVGKPTVGLEQRYGVKVFSLNNWDELLEWLNELEANMSDEHKAGVSAAYP
jgi:hypothetical protein